MAELKTKENDANVEKFLNNIADDVKREDCFKLLRLMQKITKSEAKMWGEAIVGFGNYRYKYASGREGDWFLCGFSPRKQNLTLYLMCDINRFSDYLIKLGKHKTGKGCLYVKKLEDINLKVLEQLIRASVKFLSDAYPN